MYRLSYLFQVAAAIALLISTPVVTQLQAQIIDDLLDDEWISSRYLPSSRLFQDGYIRFNSLYLQESDFFAGVTIIERGGLFIRLNSGFKIDFGQNINLKYSLRVSNSPKFMAGYSGNTFESWGAVRASNDNAMLTYQNNDVQISLGRGLAETSAYGENLLLNRSNYSSDFIYLQLNKKKIEVENLIMLLKQYNQYNRYLVYHRYSYSSNRAKFGFSDVSLIAFEKFDNYTYKYFMPYSFFYDIEANGNGFANLFWRFDVSYLVGKSLIWAELLVDDFAIDFLSPPKLGYLVGFKSEWNDYPYILKLVKINRWVYNYGSDKPQLKFIDYDLPLGNPIGPDALKLSFSSELKWRGELDWTFYPELFYRIDGEGSLEEEPPVPSGKNFGYFHQPFLTGNLMNSGGINILSVLKFNDVSLKIYLSYGADEDNSISIMAKYLFKH